MAPLVSPIAEPQLGGSQVLLADLALGLAGRGHDVRVYAASGSRIDGVEVVDTGVDAAALRSTLFRAGHGPSSGGAARAAFEWVGSMIAEDRPDVVHVHAFDAPAVDAAVATGAPAFHVLHLPPDRAVADALGRAGSRGPVPVTVSEAMRAAWSLAGVEARVIRPGIPVDRIPWRSEPGTGALFAGRLSPEKGAPDAIAIAALAGVPLTIVGQPYDERHSDEVHRLAADAGLTVRPPVPRERLWELMAASAVVLCPIRWDEPFGLVAAEAQACGTPVVGFRRGALPEILRDGVTGALVEEGDLHGAARVVAVAAGFDRTGIRRHAEASLALGSSVAAFEALSFQLAGAARP